MVGLIDTPTATVVVAGAGYVLGVSIWAARVERRLAVIESENGILDTMNRKLDDVLQRLSNLEGRTGLRS